MRANMGYTAAQVLKTPVNSGHVAPSARFFFVHGFSYGRECDGYKTRKGKKSARLFTGFELLPTPAQNGVFSLEQEPTMAQHAHGALAPVIPLPNAAKQPITNRRKGRLPRNVVQMPAREALAPNKFQQLQTILADLGEYLVYLSAEIEAMEADYV